MLASVVQHNILVVSLLSCTRVAAAQNLTIPATWQYTSNLSRESRESLAHDAALPLAKINTLGDNTLKEADLPGVQDITSIFPLLALQDYYRGNMSWQTEGNDNLQAFIEKNGFWGVGAKLYSDVIYWGLGIFYSYRTYKESTFLDTAVEAWNIVYSGAFINTSNAANGSGAGRNVSFPHSDSCTGETFAGGVFRTADAQDDLSVNMESVGPFMTLSAYLYEETKNTTYQQTAQLSLDFVTTYLWNGTIVRDTINLGSCQVRPKPFTLNQAWFVEGLSIWANVTGNETLTTLLRDVVSSVTTFPSWSFEDGVVYDSDPEEDAADQVLKGIYIRGLAEASRRNPGTDLARYIDAYISVQLNSLLGHARAPSPNDNFYSVLWTGPPPSSFNTVGNIAALDVLNAAFSLTAPSSNSSTSGPTPTSIPRSTSSKSSNNGHIRVIGGVVGGVVAAAVALAAMLLYRHRRHVKNAEDNSNNASANSSVEPFISRPAYNPTASSKSRRLNSAYQDGTSSLPASLPVLAPDTTHNQEADREPAIGEVADLTSLVRRLNNILQGRQGELPPRYDG